MSKQKRGASPRPFTTVYSGTWNRHCATLKNALRAGFNRLVEGEYSFCEVFDENGQSVARMRWTKGDHVDVMPGFKRPLSKRGLT